MISYESKLLIDFYVSNGILDIVNDDPVNHFQSTISKLNKNSSVPPNCIDEKLASPKFSKTIAGISSHPAHKAKNIHDLKTIMESFEECDLKKMATHTVFSDGNPNAHIMLVGEAPGAEEDLKGLPFVGQSGQLLDKMLEAINLNRSKVYISNIVPWRPPGNRPTTSQEIAICQPFIEKHIELIQPKLLILIGGIATKTLLNTNDGIMKIRGRWFSYETQKGVSISTMATYHPAFLMRSPAQKALSWQDMLSIEKQYQILTTSS